MNPKSNINTLIPILVNNAIVDTISFEPNLNLIGVPSYLNESCNMGLKRISDGKYKNKIVLMFEDEFHPKTNHAEFISEEKAYELCVNRGKYEIIKKYNIKPNYRG